MSARRPVKYLVPKKSVDEAKRRLKFASREYSRSSEELTNMSMTPMQRKAAAIRSANAANESASSAYETIKGLSTTAKKTVAVKSQVKAETSAKSTPKVKVGSKPNGAKTTNKNPKSMNTYTVLFEDDKKQKPFTVTIAGNRRDAAVKVAKTHGLRGVALVTNSLGESVRVNVVEYPKLPGRIFAKIIKAKNSST